MCKILPIDDNPNFREVHTSAYILSILKPTSFFSDAWLLNNAISIYNARKFGDTMSYAYPNLWFLYYFKSKISPYYFKKNIIGKIKKYIDSSYYVVLCVNEKYLPYKTAYSKNDFCHDIMIYGYDHEFFYTLSYDETGKYCSHKYLFSQIDKAHLEDPRHKFMFYGLKPNPHYPFSYINKNFILRKIRNHIKPHNSYSGINALKSAFENIDTKKAGNNFIDIRNFRLIWERAKALALLKNFFVISNPIKEELIAQEKLAEKLFYLVLRYNISSDDKTLQNIKAVFSSYIEHEIDLFENILISLKQ